MTLPLSYTIWMKISTNCLNLDARFKLAHVDDRGNILKEVETQMLREINSEVTKVPTCSSGLDSGVVISASSTSEGHETDLPPSKKPKRLSKILSKCFGNTEVRVTPQQRVKQEIHQYPMHPQLNTEDHLLPWWQSECVRYPILAKLARKCLCFCATIDIIRATWIGNAVRIFRLSSVRSHENCVAI